MSDAKRPGVATASGVLSIVFGGLGTLFGLLGLALAFGLFIFGAFGLILGLLLVVSFLVSVLGLVGGIMMLGNKKAGVNLVNLYAFISIGANVVTFILGIVVSSMPDLGFQYAASVPSLIIGAVVPVILLVLNNQKAVKEFYVS